MTIRDLMSRLSADQRGATSIEFAMLAAPMFAAILLITQVGLQMTYQAALEGAAQKLVEELSSSRFDPPPSGETLHKRACSLVAPGGPCPGSLRVQLAPLAIVAAGPVELKASQVQTGPANTVFALRLQMDGPEAALNFPGAPKLIAAVLVRTP